MVRQGDILVVKVPGGLPPRGARCVPREHGDVVLAYGEATHHRHRIRSPRAELYEHAGHRYLVAADFVQLEHEEHAPIQLPPGVYRIVRQREYVPRLRPREVID